MPARPRAQRLLARLVRGLRRLEPLSHCARRAPMRAARDSASARAPWRTHRASCSAARIPSLSSCHTTILSHRAPPRRRPPRRPPRGGPSRAGAERASRARAPRGCARPARHAAAPPEACSASRPGGLGSLQRRRPRPRPARLRPARRWPPRGGDGRRHRRSLLVAPPTRLRCSCSRAMRKALSSLTAAPLPRAAALVVAGVATALSVATGAADASLS